MNKALGTKLLATAVSIALVATPALAKKASELTYLNGQNAASAQNDLERNGFNFISSHKSSMGYVHSYWWSNANKNCVDVESVNGQVMTVNDAKDSDCGHNGDAAAAAGAVAGLAILGAVLASKSHHRQGTNYDQQQTAQFDRGYQDGLYNGAYHNYDRTDAYSNGYEKGVEERNANLSSRHHGRAGYAQVAQYSDLIGSRAAGGMDALASRGFTQVDNFASENARYSIQWRKQSRQCLQVIVSNGRLENITDIQTHPNCR